jgi:hypothetical protein
MCDVCWLHGAACVWCLVVVDRYELAWAAGFFDGEGWADLAQAEGRRTGQPMARINQADANGIPEVLRRFQRALGGLGTIGGPHREEGRIDLYRWTVSRRGDVELLHHLLVPWLGEVKLLAFATALERESARSRLATPRDEWRAWAAGVWDGEGSACLLAHRTHRDYKKGELSITQSGVGGIPELLRRFRDVTSAGHINGPYAQQGATMDIYRWKATAQYAITETIAQLAPWLSSVKQEQASHVLIVLHAQPVLPRGRPDWGNRKTHCINGHEYATARMRPYVARSDGGVPRRDSHQCLVCAREQARRRREQKRRPAADDDRRSISETASRYLLK